MVLEYKKKMAASGELDIKRKKQALNWMWSLVEDGLKERFYKHPEVKKQLEKMIEGVEIGTITPTSAAGKLLFSLDNN